MINESYVTPKEFAEFLGISVNEVRAMCREGLIKAYKRMGKWNIPKSELDYFTTVGKIDLKIKRVELAIMKSRMYRVASGKATETELFWFSIGFGRGRFARSRLLLLSVYLALLKLYKSLRMWWWKCRKTLKA